MSYEAAASSSLFGVLAVLIGGLVVTGVLIWAVRFGTQVRRREQRPPRPSEQPTRPWSGSAHEEREMREPDEVPRAAAGDGLTPHDLGSSGTKRSEDQTRPRWKRGSGGSFGSGGQGAP
ncbi:hypothetical protein SGFS_079540 [Streptomyces graminofaciens]|uniref:Secreted protein n=1 Tax=Streptomyces graminofaciens TaxID=68212 RepID=A0ABM7FJ15_9ACTN|nr:hypothetical protein SGFS_079540 [Streptomyces graminofaciens]